MTDLENRQMGTTRLPSVLVTIAALFLSGCDPLLYDDTEPPPPDRLLAVQAACDACTASQAVHPCPARPIGQMLCSGIPPARVGETMVLCAQGFSGIGAIGRFVWHSSDPQVATVTPAFLSPWHCTRERENAVLEGTGPGTATISVNEMQGNVVIRTASATVIVAESEE